MQTNSSFNLTRFVIDKTLLRQAVAEQNAKVGFIPDPTATAEQAQHLMKEQGVRAEDNIGSCAILAEREGA